MPEMIPDDLAPLVDALGSLFARLLLLTLSMCAVDLVSLAKERRRKINCVAWTELFVSRKIIIFRSVRSRLIGIQEQGGEYIRIS